ncbi:MAG: MarR family transcriptional regulator [Microlunatus sp.]
MSQATAADGSLPLARLLAIAYRQLITDLHAELAEQGWADVRPAYGFALLALRDGPLPGSELGAVLGMTKQASSKLIDALVEAGYARRLAPSGDARVRPVELTDRGSGLLLASETIYHSLESRWSEIIGSDRVAALRKDLVAVVRQGDGELPPVRPLW